MDIDRPFGITAYPSGFVRRVVLADCPPLTPLVLSLSPESLVHPLDSTANFAPSTPNAHTPEQQEESQQLREVLKPVYDEIERRLPESRYKALTLTALEQASMWAVKAIFHRR